MAVTSFVRGHRVVWDDPNWVYEDGVVVDLTRACADCGEPPTPEGFDACLGPIPGVHSACCGHGVGKPYAIGIGAG